MARVFERFEKRLKINVIFNISLGLFFRTICLPKLRWVLSAHCKYYNIF